MKILKAILNPLSLWLGSVVFFIIGGAAFVYHVRHTQDQPRPLATGRGVFRLALYREPTSIDPLKFVSGDSTYVVSNLYRGLIRYTSDGELVFAAARSCRYVPVNKFQCTLRNRHWSDGTPVRAQDFVRSFQAMAADPRFASWPLMQSIAGAEAIALHQQDPKTLGVKATSDTSLEFILNGPDWEFLDKLSDPLLVPMPVGGFSENGPFNGPYLLKSWTRHQNLEMTANPEFPGSPDRPDVRFLFVPDDPTVVNLYEKGELDFVWRLPTSLIPEYKTKPGFFLKPFNRFDFIGFNLKPGSPFANNKSLREAMATGLNFADFKKLFFALGTPGCPSFSTDVLDSDSHCVSFVAGQTHRSQMRPFVFYYNQAGGEDLRRMAEWFQAQWKQNLGVSVEIHAAEQKTLLHLMKVETPDLFRQSVPLNRPTCLAGLEKFVTKNPENYEQFSSVHFDQLADSFRTQKLDLSERQSICGVATDLLFKQEYAAIPLGRMHFAMILNPKFVGLEINSLNQLALEHLHLKGGSK